MAAESADSGIQNIFTLSAHNALECVLFLKHKQI